MGKRLLAVLVIGLAACPGGKPDCSQPFSACGGSVVGTWRLLGECNTTSILGCDVQTSSSSTLTFNSDGTFATQATQAATVTYPASCFAPDAGLSGTTCAQIGKSLMSVNGMCSGGPGSDCVCTVTNTMNAMYGGSYTTSGTQITLTASGDFGTVTPTTVDYCVSGDQLRISIKGGTGPATVEVFGR